jgi:hypothetical protein
MTSAKCKRAYASVCARVLMISSLCTWYHYHYPYSYPYPLLMVMQSLNLILKWSMATLMGSGNDKEVG